MGVAAAVAVVVVVVVVIADDCFSPFKFDDETIFETKVIRSAG